MRRCRAVVLIPVLLLAAFCVQSEPGPVTVTFIANEGFLISGGGKKVLVDALFAGHDHYDEPSEATLEKMMQGEAPFDDVDLVLVTHHHADHFDAATVAAFLENHPETVCVVTPMAAELMNEGIRKRLRIVNLEYRASTAMEIGGLKLRIYNSGHSGGRTHWHNFVYTFDLAGRTIIHEGDADSDPASWEKFAPLEGGTEIAFVHSWFMTGPVGQKIVSERIDPRNVVLMHIPARAYEDMKERVESIRERFPQTYLFREEMEERIFR